MKTGVSKAVWARWALVIVFAMLLAFLMAGLAGSGAALVKDFGRVPAGLFVLTSLAVLAALVAGCRYSLRSVSWMSETAFVSALAAAWLVTRGLIVFACLRWPLVIDEKYLHRFVGLLESGGFTDQNLGQLSSWYDYPVWLSRAFPLYYPLRALLGDADVIAVRFANVLMGAVTVCLVYALAKETLRAPYARCAAFLYFISPFQFFDAVSYTPQIPGTLVVTTAVWLIIRDLKARAVRPWQTVATGVMIGALLFTVRIQRGGFDELLLAGYPFMLLLWAVGRKRPLRTLLPACATAVVAFLVWAPSARAFDAWVESHDTHHLRSHSLGFMVRGSNPVTFGEYLLRYELLDEASAPGEKSRVLWSVLATESAKEPWIVLGALPVIKAAKLFAVGHAAPALVSSQESGDLWVYWILLAGISIYAPVILILCSVGIVRAAVHPLLGGRLVLICWVTLSAGVAVILVAEASLAYSHGFQPLLTVLAAVGAGGFRHHPRYKLMQMIRAVGPQLATAGAGAMLVWIAAATGLYLFATHAGPYLFRDMRGIRATINGLPVATEPLNRWTQSWEQQIVVPEGTALPAKLRLAWHGSPAVSSVRMSIWTDSGEKDCACGIIVRDKGHVASYSNVDLARMGRGDWPVIESASGDVIEVGVVPRGGGPPALTRPLALNVGYAN